MLPVFGGAPPNIISWPFRKISSGWDHTLAISDDPGLANSRGLVAWGLNEYGHCDIPMFSPSGLPLPPWNIDANAKVAKISAGEYVNIVLFDNGQIAAWGDPQHGVRPPSTCTGSGPGRFDPYIPPCEWRFKSVAAGGHFVMALILDAPNSGLPIDAATGRSGEGWILSWGTWVYGVTANTPEPIARGPGFRGYPDPALFVSPYNGDNGPAAVYKPPYDDIFAGHVICGGIIHNPTPTQLSDGVRPGTVHLWGSNYLNVLSDQPPDVTWEQMQAGYSQWNCGVAKEDWSNYVAQDPPLPPLPLYSLEVFGTVGGNQASTIFTDFPPAPVLGYFKLLHGSNASSTQAALCYNPNCDGSTGTPALTANDFVCFMNAYIDGLSLPVELQRVSYANCDGSMTTPVLTASDHICFTNMYARGMCP